MEIIYRSHFLILASDIENRLNFDESSKADFDKYSSIVEEISNSIKITKPNFVGANCQLVISLYLVINFLS
jgi:hypothetical protein